MTLMIALAVVLTISTAILIPQWWAWRAQDARARRILDELAPLSNGRKQR